GEARTEGAPLNGGDYRLLQIDQHVEPALHLQQALTAAERVGSLLPRLRHRLDVTARTEVPAASREHYRLDRIVIAYRLECIKKGSAQIGTQSVALRRTIHGEDGGCALPCQIQCHVSLICCS